MPKAATNSRISGLARIDPLKPNASKSDTKEPVISRLLSVPPETTFDKLHATLQIAFGWADAHEHSFRVEEDHPNGLIGGQKTITS